MRKQILAYFFFLATILLVITSCSSAINDSKQEQNKDSEHASQEEEQPLHADSGDLRETTKSVDVLPNFLKDSTDGMKAVYTTAAEHKELLEYIPCYCGCAESGNHKDNYDCYIYENKKNGEVVWDAHGTGCSVCIETTAESVSQFNEGKSIKEIRQYIDKKYKEGFAKPTPTPMPS